MGIKAYKRKILMCRLTRILSEITGVIGVLMIIAAVDTMTYSTLELLPGGIQIIAGLVITCIAYIVNKVTAYVRYR